MSRYIVTIDGREFDVQLETNGSEFSVTVNGHSSYVRKRILGASRSLLFIDGEVQEVDVRQSDEPNGRLVFMRGMEIPATVEEYNIGRLRGLLASSRTSSSQFQVLAPMPGLIVSVDVQPGERITTGQPLAVIEAMKMENVIKASTSGVLKAVHIKAGQAVEKGTIMMEFE